MDVFFDSYLLSPLRTDRRCERPGPAKLPGRARKP